MILHIYSTVPDASHTAPQMSNAVHPSQHRPYRHGASYAHAHATQPHPMSFPRGAAHGERSPLPPTAFASHGRPFWCGFLCVVVSPTCIHPATRVTVSDLVQEPTCIQRSTLHTQKSRLSMNSTAGRFLCLSALPCRRLTVFSSLLAVTPTLIHTAQSHTGSRDCRSLTEHPTLF